MSDGNKKSCTQRRQHNADLIRRMRTGDPLNAFDSKASWYPPRPIIKKDPQEMARLYLTAAPPMAPARDGNTASSKVVVLGGHSASGDDSVGEAG